MFKSLIQELITKRAARQEEQQKRIEAFKEPLAKEISWSPASSGGSNFCTRKLHKNESGILIYRPTLFSFIFSLIFIAVGAWIIQMPLKLPFSLLDILHHPLDCIRGCYFILLNILPTPKIFGVLFGLVFMLPGFFFFFSFVSPIQFDLRSRSFTKGFPLFRQTRISFQEIHALQILSELCRGGSTHSSNTYLSAELNLVLKNKSRVTLVDHNNLSLLRQEAETLSKALFVPVWDLT